MIGNHSIHRIKTTDMDMENNTTWSESPIHQKIKDAGLDDAANHCSDQSCPTTVAGYVVELEDGVWIAPWEGDPGRTLVLEHADIFPTGELAYKALAKACRYRNFTGAKVYSQNVEVSHE